jgi:hypothetical protein
MPLPLSWRLAKAAYKANIPNQYRAALFGRLRPLSLQLPWRFRMSAQGQLLIAQAHYPDKPAVAHTDFNI